MRDDLASNYSVRKWVHLSGEHPSKGKGNARIAFLKLFPPIRTAVLFSVLSVVARLMNFGWVTIALGLPMLAFLTGHVATVANLAKKLPRVGFLDSLAVTYVSMGYFLTALFVPDITDADYSLAVLGLVRNPGPVYELLAGLSFYSAFTIEVLWLISGWFRIRSERIKRNAGKRKLRTKRV